MYTREIITTIKAISIYITSGCFLPSPLLLLSFVCGDVVSLAHFSVHYSVVNYRYDSV